MTNGRNKGHSYERKIRKEMIELGYESCETSRYESKKKDDQKVDLCNTDPFNIQCKAVERGLNYFDVLNSMPNDTNHNVIFHKKNRKGELVVMRKEDFYEIIEALKANSIINVQ